MRYYTIFFPQARDLLSLWILYPLLTVVIILVSIGVLGKEGAGFINAAMLYYVTYMECLIDSYNLGKGKEDQENGTVYLLSSARSISLVTKGLFIERVRRIYQYSVVILLPAFLISREQFLEEMIFMAAFLLIFTATIEMIFFLLRNIELNTSNWSFAIILAAVLLGSLLDIIVINLLKNEWLIVSISALIHIICYLYIGKKEKEEWERKYYE